MNTEREVIYCCLLLAQVKNTDFGVRHTTTETRFWVRFVFAVAIAIIIRKCVNTSLPDQNILLTISLVVYPSWPWKIKRTLKQRKIYVSRRFPTNSMPSYTKILMNTIRIGQIFENIEIYSPRCCTKAKARFDKNEHRQ